MKIALAQTKPVKGDVSANIQTHINFIELAIKAGASAIFFPELSLTGYEPELAKELKMEVSDSRLEIFQDLCDSDNISIGL